MRQLNLQQVTHKMYIASLCGVVITMPLSLRLNSIFIILSVVSAIACFIIHKNKIAFNKHILLFVFLYLGAIVGVINSANLKIAAFDLEQKLPWLSLPLIFLIGDRLTKKEIALILKAFLLSICCVNAYAITTPESFINQLSMTWHTWNDSLKIDRIYLGIYNVFGLVIVSYLFGSSTRIIEKTIYAIAFLFLIVSLVNTFAKTAMAIFLILCLLEICYILYQRGKTWFYAGVGIIMAIIITVFSVNASLRDVAKKVMNKETFDFSNNPLLFESINFRYLTWESSWTLLKQNNNWITGVGTGDSQKLLVELYTLRLNEYDRYIHTMGYNSHNQYLTTWLNFGFVFFFILTFQFFYFSHRYYQTHLRIGIYFTIIVMISCLTESMFERQQGIVFYTFFQILLFSAVDNKQTAV